MKDLVRVSEARTVDLLQISCEHVSLELRPKTNETVSSAYQIKEDCSKRRGRSMRTDEQQCLLMKTVLTVGMT